MTKFRLKMTKIFGRKNEHDVKGTLFISVRLLKKSKLTDTLSIDCLYSLTTVWQKSSKILFFLSKLASRAYSNCLSRECSKFLNSVSNLSVSSSKKHSSNSSKHFFNSILCWSFNRASLMNMSLSPNNYKTLQHYIFNLSNHSIIIVKSNRREIEKKNLIERCFKQFNTIMLQGKIVMFLVDVAHGLEVVLCLWHGCD